MITAAPVPGGWWALVTGALGPPPPAAPTITGFSPLSGPVGTVVRLAVTQGLSVTAVQLGSVNCAFTIVSDVAIDVVVPPGV